MPHLRHWKSLEMGSVVAFWSTFSREINTIFWHKKSRKSTTLPILRLRSVSKVCQNGALLCDTFDALSNLEMGSVVAFWQLFRAKFHSKKAQVSGILGNLRLNELWKVSRKNDFSFVFSQFWFNVHKKEKNCAKKKKQFWGVFGEGGGGTAPGGGGVAFF